MLVGHSVQAALWRQTQNQGAFLIQHVNVEAAEAWQEHHLGNNTGLQSETSICLSLISSIVYSAVANGTDGLFIETHPDPKNAKSDPHTMLKLDLLYPILKKALAIRKAIS